MKVIFNGELTEGIELLPGGWLPGNGIFETLRGEDRDYFGLHRHYCRANEAAKFELPSESEVTRALERLLQAENYPVSRIRISFRDDGTWLITNHPYQDFGPVRLMIFPERTKNIYPVLKTFPYQQNLLLNKSAQSAGFDDGILITNSGEVCETSIANIALEIDRKWVTPPLTAGILNGVMRAVAIESKEIQVAPIDLAQLEKATRGILLTSLRIAQEISEIDGRKLMGSESKVAQIWKLIEGLRNF
ncbi:MAG: hypothetical protein RL301_112 [Actinomycetota bacterium]